MPKVGYYWQEAKRRGRQGRVNSREMHPGPEMENHQTRAMKRMGRQRTGGNQWTFVEALVGGGGRAS